MDDTSEEGLAGETNSFVDRLKSKFISKKKSNAADEESEDDDGSEVSNKKKPAQKKINPVVLVVVVAALAALFLIEDEEPAPETPATSFKRPVRKKLEKPVEEPSTVEASAEEPSTVEAPVEEPSTVEAPAEEPSTVEAPAEEPSTVEAPAEEPSTVETPAEEPSTVEAPVEEPSETGQTPDTTDDASLTDKILEDLEKQAKKDRPKEVKKDYVAPPDFEYRGRGLVYNCTGKHWACVDAPSYKTCEDNYSSVTYLNKKVECYPFNVYETVKGCESMQNRVVSSNAKTGFCTGN